jgi:hypothetical protein
MGDRSHAGGLSLAYESWIPADIGVGGWDTPPIKQLWLSAGTQFGPFLSATVELKGSPSTPPNIRNTSWGGQDGGTPLWPPPGW